MTIETFRDTILGEKNSTFESIYGLGYNQAMLDSIDIIDDILHKTLDMHDIESQMVLMLVAMAAKKKCDELQKNILEE